MKFSFRLYLSNYSLYNEKRDITRYTERSMIMGKDKNGLVAQGETQIDKSQIFEHVANIIETRRTRAGAYANREVTLMYWEVGQYIGSILLGGERAAYGKRIVAELAQQLIE